MVYIPDPVSQSGSEVEDVRTIKRSLMSHSRSHRYHHLIDTDPPILYHPLVSNRKPIVSYHPPSCILVHDDCAY